MRQKHKPDPQATRFAQALAFHKNGHLPQACQFYEAILARQPDHVDTLHMLAVARMQTNQHAEGVRLLEKAILLCSPSAPMLSNYGNGLSRLGRHREAVSAFTRALELAPAAPETLNNLGIAQAATGDHLAALDSYDKALALAPVFPECHNNRANALRALNRAEEAVASCLMALEQRPGYPEALNNLGLALAAAGNEEEALNQFGAAIAARPNFLHALGNRAHLLYRLGRHAEALADYECELSVQPHLYEAHNGAGLVCRALGQPDEALAHFNAALENQPDAPAALSNKGNALVVLGRTEEAVTCFERAMQVAPEFADPINNLANLYISTGRPELALPLAERVTRLAPDLPEGFDNLGLALTASDRLEEAVTAYDKALSLRPTYAGVLINRGHVLEALCRYPQAQADFSAALGIQPHNANARWNKALSHLRLGQFSEGWQYYEARWSLPEYQLPDLPMPRWQGEPLADRSILLWAEQGLGDTLQFCRYASMLADMGATVFLQAPQSLLWLMKTLKGVAGVFSQESALPTADFHSPLLSVPKYVGTDATNIPSEVPYLQAPTERFSAWQQRLPGHKRQRIGIVCAGNARFANDRNRSIPLAMFAPLLALDAELYFVQTDCREADAAFLREHPQIIDLRDSLKDFADTAAVLAQLDLLISIDTSVAHLAGAMNRPLWLMLPMNPDWRWLLDRANSPWYPGARLFRQQMRGNWAALIEQIVRELQH